MLRVTVCQVGRGAATLVELPERDGVARVGVIDSFRGEDGSHPLLRELERIEESSPTFEISFVVLTHLHADHCWGIGRVLERFGSRVRMLCEPGLDPRFIIAAQYYRKAIRDAEVAKDLDALRIFEIAKPELVRPLTSAGIMIYEDQVSGIVVRSVAPVGGMLRDMQERLVTYMRQRRKAYKERRAHRGPAGRWYDLNRTSSAVEVLYEDRRIVIGGDVLAGAWRLLSKSLELSSDAFVLSHHGAKSGFAKGVWKSQIAAQGCRAVTSGRGANQPDNVVVSAIGALGDDVWVTNLPESQWAGAIGRVLTVHYRQARATERRSAVVISVGSGVQIDGLRISSTGGGDGTRPRGKTRRSIGLVRGDIKGGGVNVGPETN